MSEAKSAPSVFFLKKLIKYGLKIVTASMFTHDGRRAEPYILEPAIESDLFAQENWILKN